MYALQHVVGGSSELASGPHTGETLPLEENEATLAEFYLDVEECSKHTSRLTRNLKGWKGLLDSSAKASFAKGVAAPSVLQSLKQSTINQLEKENEEATRLSRMKKNALLLEKHLVRLSRLCMSQEEIIHNLRQEERQKYIQGQGSDAQGQYLLEDSSYLHEKMRSLAEQLEEQASESRTLKSKVSKELESKYLLEQTIDKLERKLRKKSERLTECEANLASTESEVGFLKARVRDTDAEKVRLDEELARLDSRGLLQIEARMSNAEEGQDLTRISLKARMREAYFDRNKLERKMRIEDDEDSRLQFQSKIDEIDAERSQLRQRLLQIDAEREGEECILLNRKYILRQVRHIDQRILRRLLKSCFAEWKDLALSYKKNHDSMLDLEALSTSLTDYRFIAMKALAKWAKCCVDSRSNRLKFRKVYKMRTRNIMVGSLRAWAVYCQTLRHRRARLVQINSYFKARTVQLSFQKWRAVVRKIKRLMHPEQVKLEEKADRLRKIQLIRAGFKNFFRGSEQSKLQRNTKARVLNKRKCLLRSSVLKHWSSTTQSLQIQRLKLNRWDNMRGIRCLKGWHVKAASLKHRRVQAERLQTKMGKRIVWECLSEWNAIMRWKMYKYWVLETWGKKQRERRLREGLESFKLQIARKLRGSKFAVMMKQLNVQNLRAKCFYKWAATTVANVLSFAIQKVHDHLVSVDMGLLTMAVQYDENDPKMQDMMVLAQKIDNNLDSVKAALADAHALFQHVRRTRDAIGDYTSPIKGISDGPAAATGHLSVNELGLSPSAQAILLKRQVLNVKGQLNSYKLSKMIAAQKLVGVAAAPSSGEDDLTTPQKSSLRMSTDKLKRSLDTAVARLQSRTTPTTTTTTTTMGLTHREEEMENSSITMSDVRDMYGKVSKIRKNLESELEKSNSRASSVHNLFATPNKQLVTSGVSSSNPNSTSKHPVAWRPPGITPSPGWSAGKGQKQ